MIYETLIINSGLIFTLVGLYNLVSYDSRLGTKTSRIFLGIIFGVITVASMSFPLRLMDGLIFDGRSIVLSMSGLFGGPVVAIISTIIAAIHRAIIGGVGTLTGIATIFASAVLGVVFHKLREKNVVQLTPINLYGFSIIVHVVVVFLMFTLPGDLKWLVVKSISLPFVTILPFGSFLLGMVLCRQEYHRQNEMLLHESNKRYSSMFENMFDGAVIFQDINNGKDFRIIEANNSFLSRNHYNKKALIGLSVNAFLSEPYGNQLLEAMHYVWKTGERKCLNEFYVNEGSTYHWFDINLFRMPSGQIVLMCKDVTKRKTAEREREQLFNMSLDMLCIAGFDGYFKQVNPAFEHTLGWNKVAFLEKPWIEFVHPEDIESTVKAGESLMRGEKVIRFRNRYKCKNGSYRWLSWNSYPQPSEGLIFAVVRDITESIHAQKKIEEKKTQVDAIYKAADNIAFIITDSSCTEPVVLDYSKGAEHLFGYIKQEITGSPISVLFNKGDIDIYPKMKHLMTKGKLGYSGEMKFVQKSGESFLAFCSSYPLLDKSGDFYAILNVIVDISEIKKLEEQIQQTQRLESLGTLTAGIAHDFNNLLTTIIGNAHILSSQINSDSALYGDVEQIKIAGEKAANLTRQLLAYSRKQIIRPTIFNLNDVICESEKLLKRLIRENISLTTYKADELYPIKADVSQLEQVIINLVVNAKDAMPNGGEIFIETKNITLDKNYFKKKGVDGKQGLYTMLTVKDTGEGISQENIRKIFDPFFTTKPKGKGTGMGLSTVYGIVKQGGGFIWASSTPGDGTNIEVFWPAYENHIKAKDKKEIHDIQVHGKETILAVEDDPSVLKFVQKTLSSSGYNVMTAKNGKDAIRICHDYHEPIHLLLTDVVMPGMSGMDMSGQLNKIIPDLKIVFMSGYPNEQLYTQEACGTVKHYLEKPLTPAGVLCKVREVLDAA